MTEYARHIRFGIVSFVAACFALSGASFAQEGRASPPTTVAEARSRARLLHEAFHATLHVVHQRYYREDEGLIIPAKTLESVFRELEKTHGVSVRWLAVNAPAMNVDHEPKGEFEEAAARALSKGKGEYEAIDDGVYRRVGAVTLTSECLKCHVPNRTSLEDRVAGLSVSMSLGSP